MNEVIVSLVVTMQCIICGIETKMLKSFDRVTVGFCGEHYPEAFSLSEKENAWERKKVIPTF